MAKDRLSILSHLDPRRDMDHALAQAPSGFVFVPYRNFVRGAVVGALAGAGLDHLFPDGGTHMTTLFAANGGLIDGIQGLGRGVIQIAEEIRGRK